MFSNPIPFWKKAPFFRLLLPLMAGILIQWYLDPSPLIWITGAIPAIVFIVLTLFAGPAARFRFRSFTGCSVFLLLACIGGVLCRNKNIADNPAWFGKTIQAGDSLLVTLTTAPEQKARSWKAIANAEQLRRKGSTSAICGTLYIYFEKDNSRRPPGKGSRLLLCRNIIPVASTGNPYAFNYKEYSLFQGITHQCYIPAKDLRMISTDTASRQQGLLPSLQAYVLSVIRHYIPANREAGLAEALLIGYKRDLDPQLVSAYTDTGLAHVIAISGMHLALVYWLLMLIFRPLEKRKRFRLLAPSFTITGLWIFTLLAGAQPSVLRSAVMFSCIILGRTLTRDHSIYNSLSASAFLLLCFNPFWLWDLGFQLSYAAVLSLLIFMQPVYSKLFFRNKLVDLTWKAVAVSLSAQVLTTPLSIFHFHQFPVYFLLANLIAVPLSTLILITEIFLCAIAFCKPIAILTGSAIAFMIRQMNRVIDHLASLPFATWDSLRISILQVIVLYFLITALYYFRHTGTSYRNILMLLLILIILRSASFSYSAQQQWLIVYNVPKKSVTAVVRGRSADFTGDPPTAREFSFHIEPSLIYYRASSRPREPTDPVRRWGLNLINIPGIDGTASGRLLLLGKKGVPLLWKLLAAGADSDSLLSKLPVAGAASDSLLRNHSGPEKRELAVLLELFATFRITDLVLDSSIPAWEADRIKASLSTAPVQITAISTEGALVLDLRNPP